MLELLLLGHPSIRLCGESARSSQPGPKQLALLAYLAVGQRGRGVRRERLVGLFWPDSPEERARTALRQLLRSIRRSCGSAVLASGSDGIRLRSESIRCDVWEFQQHITEGRPEEALALYRGEFMLGFHLRDAAEWESWLDVQRFGLRDQACEAHWDAARRTYHERCVRDSIRHVRRALTLRPFDERGTRQLMFLLASSGDRASALREYERFAEMLQSEMAVPPDPQTCRLRDRIVAGALDGTPCFAPASNGDRTPWSPDDEVWR